jgi:hypothetical protein
MGGRGQALAPFPLHGGGNPLLLGKVTPLIKGVTPILILYDIHVN